MHEHDFESVFFFFSTVVLLHDITVIYYKPKGGTNALFSPSAHFSGTTFPALVHLVLNL